MQPDSVVFFFIVELFGDFFLKMLHKFLLLLVDH